MEYLQHLNDLIWQESNWLSPNITWKDLQRTNDQFIPAPSDLFVIFPIAVFLFGVRLLWESQVALPLGRFYELRESPSFSVRPNVILEKAFQDKRKIFPSYDLVVNYAKQLDWTPRQVERWWRRRQLQNKPCELQRFKETSWRFVYYIIASWSGIFILWDKTWFWNTKECWYGHPKQHVPAEIWWYYMIELGFYVSLIMSLCMDVRRKDFVQMVIHHIATIFLMSFSWSINFVRIGTLVLCVHDAVDYWMEGAKLAKYCRYSKLCDFLFLVFAILWFVTRIVIYPIRILNSSIFESYEILREFPFYYFLNALLILLQVLHIIWFYMILKMVYKYVIKGEVEKDGRSDTEPDSVSEDDYMTNQSNLKSTNGENRGDGMHITDNIMLSNGDGLTMRHNGASRM